MTEAEWLSCTDPALMLEVVRSTASDRKLRLFAVACCQGAVVISKELSQSLQVAEEVADGLQALPMGDLTHYWEYHSIFHRSGGPLEWACHSALSPSAWSAASEVVRKLDDESWREGAGNWGVACLREVFSNPFRPAAIESSWRTSTVLALATEIYADRAFDRLPILADALEDAGCTDAAILDHCRQPGEHVRGCWVVDLVLEKS